MQETADIQSGYLPPVPDFSSHSPFGGARRGSNSIPLTPIPNRIITGIVASPQFDEPTETRWLYEAIEELMKIEIVHCPT
jgi:hypothetical protein